MFLVLMLFACTQAPEDEEEEWLPSEYLPPETDVVEPSYTGEAIGMAIDEALAVIYELNAQPVITGYLLAINGQDTLCPRYYSNEAGSYWFDNCTSESGTFFSGYGFYALYDNVYNEENGSYLNGQAISAAGTMTTGDEDVYNAAGYAAHYVQTFDNQPTISNITEIHGTFSWTGASAEESWMLEGLSPDLSVGAYVNPEYDGRYIYLNGGVSGFVGDTTAILFDQVVLIEGTLGGPCPQEPYGTISVRGEEGEWYDVLFDGPDPNNEWQLDPAECDGIGHAFFRGESIGEVTVDFTGLYLWEESPW